MYNRKIKEWNKSYKNRDNFVFYPHEDIVRFISKYIKKRVGLNEFINKSGFDVVRVLDIGCGIGRHIKVLDEFNIEAYGFDLSDVAISIAKSMFKEMQLTHLIDKVIVADITDLPYEDKYFHFMLSHGVLDSMPFNIARRGIKELYRCLHDKGKVYFDLISDIDHTFDGNYEKEVKGDHENGTIQSYFNEDRINKLIEDFFEIEEIKLSVKKDIKNNIQFARYHVVVRKI